ncbi:kazrin isoform X4 [Cloeon dipterum]|uniref:kazrin isoform X4 n=1 Tax=Cloeon dipterum TaxID=197152 RepID=UPI003220550F
MRPSKYKLESLKRESFYNNVGCSHKPDLLHQVKVIRSLRCLDALHEQIGQSLEAGRPADVHLSNPSSVCDDGSEDGDRNQQAFSSSMALMRRLLEDAQAKFRRMVDENKTLATRIDGDLQAAQEDVGVLRGELADANRRLEELAVAPSCEAGGDASPPEQAPKIPPSPPPRLHVPAVPVAGSCPSAVQEQTEPVAGCSSAPAEAHQPVSHGSIETDPGEGSSSCGGGSGSGSLAELRDENARLKREIAELKCLLGPEALALSAELESTRDALAAVKADRKRLKAEKYDLLNQMKQLYSTLEDKEKELRDFIRNYEQMRDTEVSTQQLAAEREERERERWTLLRHARDEAERSLALAAQLTARETQIQQLQEHILEIKRATGFMTEQDCRVNGSGTPTSSGLLSSGGVAGLVGTGLPGDRGSSADSGVRGSSDRESGATSAGGGNLSDSNTDGTPTITVETGGGGNIDMDSISVVSSIIGQHTYQNRFHNRTNRYAVTTPKDSPTLSPMSANPFARMIQDNNVLSSPPPRGACRSVEQLQDSSEPPTGRRKGTGRLGRGGTWGSISRVFARSRHRKMTSPSHEAVDPYRSWSPLTEEGYAEKLRLLREASTIPMERWRAPTVLAWLEIALGMPQYGPRCAENVKSGKVLLELSDVELEVGLGITHPMHRKKLRLAIEEHRHPSLVRYPCMAQLGHTWVSSEWLPDLGLAQYSENFATNMVDARMLDHLSKKELEKFLGVTRKFHQASIVHGIHLLRMMKYDRQALAVRRHQCENIDADPIVWTNQRFIRWARNIDLNEYADNLKDSGVHGALVVLEPSFNGETMASALGIPQSKNIIRRHLTTELEALVLPARAAVEHYMKISKAERRRYEKLMSGGSLGRSFSRSYAGGLQDHHHHQDGASIAEGSGAELAADKDRSRRASLRLPNLFSPSRDFSMKSNSLQYLKKFSSWRSSQGSLSRALGLRVKQELQRQQHQLYHHHEAASPESSLASPTSEAPSFLAESEPHGLPASSSSTSSGSARQQQQHHRRVRSIGDIEAVSAVTPV